MSQLYTSAATSINSRKAPAIVHQLHKANLLSTGMLLLDYGCGRYPETTRAALCLSPLEYAYCDPYNVEPAENGRNRARVMAAGGADVVMCANVLNVIDSDDAVQAVVDDAIHMLADRCGSTAVFSVYEGDRSGTGRQTKTDCWQRNQKLRDYVRFFSRYSCSHDWAVTLSGGAIWVTNIK